jgi:hypothetical protein
MYKKGKAISIKAPRPSVTSGNEYVTKLWTLLHNAIQAIYLNNASDLSYEELYRSAYNMVLNRHGETLYDNVQECMTARVDKVTKFISSNEDPTLLLRIITKEWEQYKTATSMISDILMYLDKSTVANNKYFIMHSLTVKVQTSIPKRNRFIQTVSYRKVTTRRSNNK